MGKLNQTMGRKPRRRSFDGSAMIVEQFCGKPSGQWPPAGDWWCRWNSFRYWGSWKRCRSFGRSCRGRSSLPAPERRVQPSFPPCRSVSQTHRGSRSYPAESIQLRAGFNESQIPPQLPIIKTALMSKARLCACCPTEILLCTDTTSITGELI